MTIDEAKKISAMLAHTYPPWARNLAPTAEGTHGIDLFESMLQGIDAQLGYRACLRWIKTQKWGPQPSELRGTAIEILEETLPSLDEAWEEVLDAATRGAPPTEGWSHPAVDAVVAAMHFPQLVAYIQPQGGGRWADEAGERLARQRQARSTFAKHYKRWRYQATTTASVPSPAAYLHALHGPQRTSLSGPTPDKAGQQRLRLAPAKTKPADPVPDYEAGRARLKALMAGIGG